MSDLLLRRLREENEALRAENSLGGKVLAAVNRYVAAHSDLMELLVTDTKAEPTLEGVGRAVVSYLDEMGRLSDRYAAEINALRR